MNLPITFYVFGDPTIIRTATRYDNTLVQVTSKFGTSLFSKASVEKHFEDGSWVEISFAEEDAPKLDWRVHNGPVEEICEVRVNGVVVEKERELVLPIVYNGSKGFGTPYEITRDAAGRLWWECLNSGWKSGIPNLYSEDEVKAFIKDGTWVVKSVGPQKPAEPPTSASKPLVVSVDSEQLALATGRANELAESIERVNIALESFAGIIKSLDVDVSV